MSNVPKLLKETEVYVKYGLHEKALDHLGRVFAIEPDNTEALEKAKTLALAMKPREVSRMALASRSFRGGPVFFGRMGGQAEFACFRT